MWTVTVYIMDSTSYTIMHNDNNAMNHKQRHELYYTGYIIIIQFNSI